MHKPSLTESNSEPHVMQKICQQQKVFSREEVLPCKANFLSREKALSRENIGFVVFKKSDCHEMFH